MEKRLRISVYAKGCLWCFVLKISCLNYAPQSRLIVTRSRHYLYNQYYRKEEIANIKTISKSSVENRFHQLVYISRFHLCPLKKLLDRIYVCDLLLKCNNYYFSTNCTGWWTTEFLNTKRNSRDYGVSKMSRTKSYP